MNHQRRDALRQLLALSVTIGVGAAVAGSNIALRAVDAAEARIYLFVASEKKPSALQRLLGTHLQGSSVTVFGRFRDFERRAKLDVPDLIVCRAPVLQALGFEITDQGSLNGATDEPYSLVSMTRDVDLSKLGPDVTVGAVDTDGRKSMGPLLARIIGLSRPPKLALVTKTEDLVPLLQFQVADLVVLPSRLVQSVIGFSRLDLHVRELPNRARVAAAAAVSSVGKEAMLSLRSIEGETSSLIGVDAWL